MSAFGLKADATRKWLVASRFSRKDKETEHG
jgi:hypothetical protein